ncbi:class I SAM-dependent methyltransferase [bacterium]|nr:class I SAM-dependent methyltransferase [bacterium]
MAKYQDRIEAQYNKHPYPEPISNMDEYIKNGYAQGSCPKIMWHRLFPEKKYCEDLNVLIAGCGTNQAIYHALKHPKSEHYAIDVSEASLSHVSKMIKKYNIQNLTIDKKDILELKEKNKFDYVISTGVIHHTKNPQASLNRLVEITKNDGALFIMVYASYLRMGIYLLQDAFKYLNLKSNNKDINLAKRLIELLPKSHYAHNYLDEITDTNLVGTKDLSFDAGIVDTFFNARDVAYNINELKYLINSSGAYFQNWNNNSHFYRPLFNFKESDDIDVAYKNLNNWDLSDFTQKMHPSAGKFNFTLRKKKIFENRFFKIKELTHSLVVRKMPERGLEIKPVETITGVSKNKEEIILMNLDNTIENIYEKSNKLISKKYPSEKLSFKDLQRAIHTYWKVGYITLSDY